MLFQSRRRGSESERGDSASRALALVFERKSLRAMSNNNSERSRVLERQWEREGERKTYRFSFFYLLLFARSSKRCEFLPLHFCINQLTETKANFVLFRSRVVSMTTDHFFSSTTN